MLACAPFPASFLPSCFGSECSVQKLASRKAEGRFCHSAPSGTEAKTNRKLEGLHAF